MRRVRPILVAALISAAAVVLLFAACEGGKSPTAPQLPNLAPAAPASSGEPPVEASTVEGEQQEGEEGGTAVVAEAKAEKVTICHRTGNGSFHAITVAEPALSAHLAHGDALPGTGGLDEDCEPAGTPEPSGTPTDTPVPGTTETPTDTPTNTPLAGSATPTDTPTNTAAPPTATPTDTPTNTPVPPTATPTDTPTNTPAPPTATATDTPTNTPAPPTATPTASGVAICHRTGSGDFDLIFVDPPAVPTHLGHGDMLPGTGGLDENCEPTG